MIRISQRKELQKGKAPILWVVLCMFGLSLTAGCSITPNYLKTEAIGKIKKLVIITTLQDEKLRIFDHTEVWKENQEGLRYAGVFGGAALTGIVGIAAALEANSKIRESLGGNPDLLRELLREYPIKEILEEKLIDKVSEMYEIVDANHLLDELRESQKGQKYKIEDYLDVCRKCEADTMLKIDFYYGLAAYSGEKPSAAIVGNILVYDVKTKELLMKKAILSDQYFREGRTVPEFSDNGAELFKEDIIEAVDSISLLLASDLGLDVVVPQSEQVQKKGFDNYPNTLSGGTLTCNKPYKFEQDCSFWSGAKRFIKIKERKIKVAGSDDGKIILVEDKLFTNNESMFACFELVREELQSKGISVVKVIKVMTMNRVWGCILELDGDGYSILKNYSVDRN